jgi:hypothetical protein
MTRYFLQGTPLAEFEKEMMRPPGFRRRGGGFGGGINISGTLSCGCSAFLPYHELVRLLMAEADIIPLACRTQHVLASQIELPYRDALHEKRMRFLLNKWHSCECPPPSAFAAAVYLLTADNLLWKKSESVTGRYCIDFRAVDIRGISIEGYALFITAKGLYLGRNHVALADLCDHEIISDEMYRLIIAAYTIRRYGVPAARRQLVDLCGNESAQGGMSFEQGI